MRQFNRVAVLMGGPSSEREISLRSGEAVARGLRTAGYTVLDVDVRDATLEALPDDVEAVFIALHGAFGEDGAVQELLEQCGIPYTGAGPEGSRVAFDKRLSKEVFARHGISSARYEVLAAGDVCGIDFPVVLKPPRQGSSIGIHTVRRADEWGAAFQDACSYDGVVVVEAFIAGSELTVGIVGDEALPVVEIVAPEGNYDFHAKYTKGVSGYRVPAPIDAALTARCQALALEVFKALDCRGLGRVDFRLTPEGELFVLELNTIPGFTETSLLPMAAAEIGLSFSALCDKLIQMACVGK